MQTCHKNKVVSLILMWEAQKTHIYETRKPKAANTEPHFHIWTLCSLIRVSPCLSFVSRHASLQSQYDLGILATSGVSPLNKVKMQLPDLHRFAKPD